MMRQFGDVIVERSRVDCFDRMAHMFMQLLAPFQQQRVVGNFLGKGVFEDVFDIGD